MYANARKYGLLGTDAMVFEAIVYLCKHSKDGTCKISYTKLADFSCCGNHDTARRCFNHLLTLGLIAQNEQGYAQIAQPIAQIAQKSKKERTKEENIIKESGVVIDSTTTYTTFIDFWTIFSPNGEFKRYEKTCKKIWQTMPENWRKLAIERAASRSVDRNPLYYLQDEDFLRVGENDKTQTEKPHWLSGNEINDALRDGIPLAVCQNPDNNLFGTVTKEHAELFKLTIKRFM